MSIRYPHSTHYSQTRGSHNRFDCRSESSVRAVFALNLAITRLRWSRWKDEVRMRPHSSYPWPGRANRQMSMGPESGNPSILEDSDTVHFVQDLGFVPQCVNTQQCEQRDDTTRVVGDRLHIPTFHQLPLHLGGLWLYARTKVNSHKHCLLRRTSDSCLAK